MLVEHIAAHRARLLAGFRTPSWPAIAAEYGATEGTPRERLETALNAVAAWSRRWTDDPALHAHLDVFTAEALKEVAPRTDARAGLGMIFANAGANTDFWARHRSPNTPYVAACGACGAPQGRVLNFTCEHCDQPLYDTHTPDAEDA